MCWNSWGLSLPFKTCNKPKNHLSSLFSGYTKFVFRTVQLEISGTDKMLNLPGFPLHPLPNTWCKARARSCLPTEGGGSPLCLAPFLPVRPLTASRVQRLVTAAPGAELPRYSLLLYCASSILHVLSWSILTMISISLFGLDLGSRTEGCDALAALPQQWAGDAGPEAHLGSPFAVEGVGSSW